MSHPLGTTYDVHHLRFTGKHVVDFLLVLIELFASLAVLEAWPWPRGHLEVLVLVLALDDEVLALAPQVLELALREKSWPQSWLGQDFSPRPRPRGCCMCMLCSQSVSHDSLSFLV